MNDFTIAVLHSGAPPTGWLHSNWRPEPGVVLSTFLLAALYILWTGPLNRRRPGAENRPVTGRQTTYFLLGCVLYFVALGPPLDDWSGFYLLSAHMLQHMIVLLGVAPLLLAGTPAWVLQPLADNRYTNKIGWALTRPIVAGFISTVIIVLWHVPDVYNGALRHQSLHMIQHVAFLVAGLLAAWPVLGPLPAWPRIQSPPLQCVYLFIYAMPVGMVGAFITLAATGFYSYYDTVPRIFGISLDVDQQLAGLLMWVGGTTFALLWITYIFLRWAGAEERADRESRSAPATVATSGPEGV